jgi:hypothetical protein
MRFGGSPRVATPVPGMPGAVPIFTPGVLATPQPGTLVSNSYAADPQARPATIGELTELVRVPTWRTRRLHQRLLVALAVAGALAAIAVTYAVLRTDAPRAPTGSPPSGPAVIGTPAVLPPSPQADPPLARPVAAPANAEPAKAAPAPIEPAPIESVKPAQPTRPARPQRIRKPSRPAKSRPDR